MLNFMEITDENKKSLISELKGRAIETEQEIILSVNNILSKVKKEDFELISEHGKLVTEALAYAYDFNDSNENFH